MHIGISVSVELYGRRHINYFFIFIEMVRVRILKENSIILDV